MPWSRRSTVILATPLETRRCSAEYFNSERSDRSNPRSKPGWGSAFKGAAIRSKTLRVIPIGSSGPPAKSELEDSNQAYEPIFWRFLIAAFAQTTTRSRSFTSTCCPGCARTSTTSPSLSARTAVSIFIASRVSSTSPRVTLRPTAVLTVATVPGIGAPRCPGLPGSALRGGGRRAT